MQFVLEKIVHAWPSLRKIVIPLTHRLLSFGIVITTSRSYTGYEQRSDKWKKIYDNPSLTLNGTGQPTQLGEMISDVSLPIGSYQSFYIWAEKKLVYKRGTVGMEHSPSNFDESLVVFEGIAMYSPSIWSKTSVIYSPRIWSGTIHYSASAE